MLCAGLQSESKPKPTTTRGTLVSNTGQKSIFATTNSKPSRGIHITGDPPSCTKNRIESNQKSNRNVACQQNQAQLPPPQKKPKKRVGYLGRCVRDNNMTQRAEFDSVHRSECLARFLLCRSMQMLITDATQDRHSRFVFC
mmetsp:Transcript_26598/g.73162  ORF Transcript_26598/g.73162 Transcript_26598/m.73162 type:complete len:141 (+) Transcript_26598:2528-2950(+)